MEINKTYKSAVNNIKEVILRSQYRAASSVNREQLSLYYGIGRYVSLNSRDGFWGTGAIEQISKDLQKELPGLRGFSSENIKKMRHFYEVWEPVINRSPVATDLQTIENQHSINRSPTATDLVVNENLLLVVNRQPTADEFNPAEFLQIGFTHHMEIIALLKQKHWRLVCSTSMNVPLIFGINTHYEITFAMIYTASAVPCPTTLPLRYRMESNC
ncbi:hypothetical protein SAMD00024442_41_24 [Candidatus Symbiothrix dinenymphae]|nr:hypothetical protein SAMD00024442_41_24 [Candidatus Symbiothrix dinenymphae]